MIVIFDVETNGMADFKLPLDDPKQPHVLQLALALIDDAGKEVAAYKTLIKPQGFEVDERLIGDDGKKTAFSVNGLGNEILQKEGIPIKEALDQFRSFQDRSNLKVAHNYRFDGFLMKCEYQRLGLDPGPVIDKFCTMKAMTDIMNLPPTEKMMQWGMKGPKSPSLAEAYKYCTGNDIVDAHDALGDVRSCAAVYLWLKAKGLDKEHPRVGAREVA